MIQAFLEFLNVNILLSIYSREKINERVVKSVKKFFSM